MDGGTSPAGVRSARLRFRLNGQDLAMSRLEYPAWQTPIFSFNWRESAFMPKSESYIARLDALFRGNPTLGYKLVDYGPLEMTEQELSSDDS
jgi:hypothetical protein